jgi:hypothetical protein
LGILLDEVQSVEWHRGKQGVKTIQFEYHLYKTKHYDQDFALLFKPSKTIIFGDKNTIISGLFSRHTEL